MDQSSSHALRESRRHHRLGHSTSHLATWLQGHSAAFAENLRAETHINGNLFSVFYSSNVDIVDDIIPPVLCVSGEDSIEKETCKKVSGEDSIEEKTVKKTVSEYFANQRQHLRFNLSSKIIMNNFISIFLKKKLALHRDFKLFINVTAFNP